MSYIIETQWQTKAGLPSIVIMNTIGFRCGYVGVPATHPLYGVNYGKVSEALLNEDGEQTTPEAEFNVHGGLTFSGWAGLLSEDCQDFWWFGFDCGHAYDLPSPEYIAKISAISPISAGLYDQKMGVHRSNEFVQQHCEELAMQLVIKVLFPTGIQASWDWLAWFMSRMKREEL